MKWFPLPFGWMAVLVGPKEGPEILSGLGKLQRWEAERGNLVALHEHRITIDTAGFRVLVHGEEETATCSCGDAVKLLLEDIGYGTMIGIVGIAKAGKD